MVVGPDGAPTLPWLAQPLAAAVAMAHSHALLVHGAVGAGSFELALAIGQAWLCEGARPGGGPCGRCGACRQLQAHAHPDLMLLLPEELRQTLGLQVADGDADTGEGRSRRKASRQIRIDEVRGALDWVATTSARGRAKVVVVHPAEALNPQSANALLKALEEPPRGVRWVLTAERPARLLPTVRSRCQQLRLGVPDACAAAEWLRGQGLPGSEVLMAACSQLPLDARGLAAAGVDAARWSSLAASVLAGDAQALSGWPLARVVDTLQKLCHDGLSLAAGARPRFFPPASLPQPASLLALARWSRELARSAARVEHPWNEALFVDALVLRAGSAWRGEAVPLATLDP